MSMVIRSAPPACNAGMICSTVSPRQRRRGHLGEGRSEGRLHRARVVLGSENAYMTAMTMPDPTFVPVLDPEGKMPPHRVATLGIAATGAGVERPTVVWVGGFMSDMESTKAVALDAWARANERGFVRFDYFGHGRSEGAFIDGRIGLWLADTLAVLRACVPGPAILVGSSMGAWISLLAARALASGGEHGKVAGAVLIAPAIDFTERLIWDRFTPDIRRSIEVDGVWLRPSPYGAP